MASLSDELVRQLLDGRYVATLGTEHPSGFIHLVAVWFHFDGTHLFVATSSRSRKARNMNANAKVSLMIDSRDTSASRGVTIVGTGELLTGELSQRWNAQIHQKYLSSAALADTRVGAVFAAWDDATIRITPASVIAWDMREADEQVFGGAMRENPTYLLPLER